MKFRAVLLLSVALWCLTSQAKQFAVVVDKSNTLPEISSAELAKILAFDTTTWKNGRNVQVVLRDPSTTDVQEALQKLLKIPADKVKALFAARKGSFLVAKSDDEVLTLVASHPGSVGLVDVYSINSKVSVLKVDSKLPLESGYPLR